MHVARLSLVGWNNVQLSINVYRIKQSIVDITIFMGLKTGLSKALKTLLKNPEKCYEDFSDDLLLIVYLSRKPKSPLTSRI